MQGLAPGFRLRIYQSTTTTPCPVPTVTCTVARTGLRTTRRQISSPHVHVAQQEHCARLRGSMGVCEQRYGGRWRRLPPSTSGIDTLPSTSGIDKHSLVRQPITHIEAGTSEAGKPKSWRLAIVTAISVTKGGLEAAALPTSTLYLLAVAKMQCRSPEAAVWV